MLVNFKPDGDNGSYKWQKHDWHYEAEYYHKHEVPIMGIFLWREVKRAERYENLYNEERRLRHEAESKCATCQFVQRANEELLERIKDKDDKPTST